MRIARLYLTFALVILASCEQPAANDEASDLKEVKQIEKLQEIGRNNRQESQQENEENDEINEDDPLISNTDQLPILPPIILLDFANDLDNSTSSGDEKSKRTIDSNLGYGFGRNNLFTGKYNYYFPAGKTGTTVSIEESISPFLPKTIIESVKPITEKTYPGDTSNTYGQNPLQQNNYQALQAANRQVQTSKNRYVGSQPIFGQRTKLYKPSQIDYSAYPALTSSPKSTVESLTTTRPDYRSPIANAYGVNQNNYATSKPGVQPGSHTFGFSQGGQTSQRPFASFSTPSPPAYVTPTDSSYQTRYAANSAANGYSTPRPSFDVMTTQKSVNLDSQSYTLGAPLTSFANLPRFTIENGVRYEHKIVWKYPDGKISQTPPTSYVNAYNEFLTKQKPGIGGPGTSHQNFGSSGSFPSPGSTGSFSSSGSTGSFSSSGSSGSFPSAGPTTGYQAPGASVTYQNLGSGQTSFQNQNYQNQVVRYQNPQGSRYPPESVGNIYSKSPAQFPSEPEASKSARPSQFISSASLLSSANYAIGSRPQASQGQSFGYHGQFGLKNPLRSGISSGSSSGYSSGSSPGISSGYSSGSSPGISSGYSSGSSPGISSGYSSGSSSGISSGYSSGYSSGSSSASSSASSSGYQGLLRDKTPKDPYGATYEEQKLIPKYAVNSPNPEYTYSTESPLKSTTPAGSSALFTPSGTLSPNVLSKYSTQAQNYLTKVFASGNSAASSSSGSYSSSSTPHVDTNYESLLNYNPSISQYIRNPSSILNAQPTFIQAGNSLIPVIILRVDGAPPIQPKTTPNINLKALLQQYLTQYAGSIEQNANNPQIGNTDYIKSATSAQSPLRELTQLAQSLTQYRQDPSIADNYAKQFEGSLNQSPYETSNSYVPGRSSYETIGKSTDSDTDPDGLGKYGARTKKPQKVKSVQIIEDPRFTSYKVNS